MNELNPAGKSKKLIISTVILLLVFPIINYLVLSFVYEYIAGDIIYLTGSLILYYATEAFSFALTYICFGMVIASVIKYGVKGCRFVVAAGYIALLLPYLSGMLIKLILTTDFRDYVWYYIAYTVLNYILLDGVILTVVLLFTVLFKKKMKKRGSSPQRIVISSLKKLPIIPCLSRPNREINIIKEPKKTFNSLRGILILANRNEVSKSKNGTKTEIKPKYSVNF